MLGNESMFIFSQSSFVTQQNGIELKQNPKIDIVSNLSSFPKMILDVSKYRTTNDIFRLSLTGPRSDEEYNMQFAVHNPLTVIAKS